MQLLHASNLIGVPTFRDDGSEMSTRVHQTLFSRSGDVIHPLLCMRSGNETRGGGGVRYMCVCVCVKRGGG